MTAKSTQPTENTRESDATACSSRDNQCSALDRLKAPEGSPPRPCPPIEDHVGEELQGGPCEAEVTQEHIRQLREVVVNQRQALIAVQRILWDLLPNGDWRIELLNEHLNKDATPWIK